MTTLGITAIDFILYGCPCCCKFDNTFYDFVIHTRIAMCNKTKQKFHIVTEGEFSAVADDNANKIKVIKHPLGQI